MLGTRFAVMGKKEKGPLGLLSPSSHKSKYTVYVQKQNTGSTQEGVSDRVGEGGREVGREEGLRLGRAFCTERTE